MSHGIQVENGFNLSQSEIMYNLSFFKTDLHEFENDEYYNSGLGGIKRVIFVISSLYVCTLLISVVGNCIVCYVVIALQRLRNVTNVYIVNLSISDIIVCALCAPFRLTADIVFQYWPFWAFMCPFVNFVWDTALTQRSLTLVAMNVDRYYAIAKPLKKRVSKFKTKRIILAFWLLALFLSLPTSLSAGVMFEQCVMDWKQFDHLRKPYNCVIYAIQYYIPLFILCFTYIHIGVIIWKKPPGEVDNSRDRRMAIARKRTIKMLVVVALMFFICWSPRNTMPFIEQTMEPSGTTEVLYLVARWFAVINMSSNPFIYCWMNNSFKQGFSRVASAVACRKQRSHRRQRLILRRRALRRASTTEDRPMRSYRPTFMFVGSELSIQDEAT